MRTAEVTMVIECALEKEHFAPWEKLTPEQRALFNDKTTNCDGIGVFGWWCAGCDFCLDIGIDNVDVDNGD